MGPVTPGGTAIAAIMLFADLAGAVALLLWGLRMVRTGMVRACGAALRNWLGFATTNRVRAFAAGFAATLLLQSSTATTLMIAAFAGRGTMATSMALAIVLGADLGTAAVAQLMTLDLRWLGPLLILLGFAAFNAGEDARRRAVGRALLGLGLMLLSLRLIGQATLPLREAPALQAALGLLAERPALVLLLGAGLTALAHSSLAVVLFAAALAGGGAIDGGMALALVLGANIGGSLPALLATWRDHPLARRVPAGNAIARTALALAALSLLEPLAALTAALGARWGADAAAQATLFHLGFNLALAALFLPLLGPLARLAALAVPARPPADDPHQPRHLDPQALEAPPAALACATLEALRMAGIVETMLRRSLDVVRRNDSRLLAEIGRMDDQVDSLHEAVKLYLVRLSGQSLDAAESRRAAGIMAFAINLEHIGDIVDSNVLAVAARKIKAGAHFSEEGLAEIAALHGRVLENLRLALALLVSGDARLAERLAEGKRALRGLERAAAEGHFARMRCGRQESIVTSALHLDLLRDLARINSHVMAMAYPFFPPAGPPMPAPRLETRAARLGEAPAAPSL